MTDIFRTGLQAINNDSLRLDMIARNIANATTPAYKREIPVLAFGSRASSFAQQVSAGIGEKTNAQAGLKSYTDYSIGTVRATGQSLDFALTGQGYFEVLTPEGLAYTRQGSFSLDASGRLVTAQGYPVMGLDGEIVLQSPTPVVDGQGRFFESPSSFQRQINSPNAGALPTSIVIPSSVDGSRVQTHAQLKVVDLPTEFGANVTRRGASLFIPSVGGVAQPRVDAGITIKQGFLEGSNVQSATEMVELMQIMRHVESVHKAMMSYDEMLGTAIRKLGELS